MEDLESQQFKSSSISTIEGLNARHKDIKARAAYDLLFTVPGYSALVWNLFFDKISEIRYAEDEGCGIWSAARILSELLLRSRHMSVKNSFKKIQKYVNSDESSEVCDVKDLLKTLIEV